MIVMLSIFQTYWRCNIFSHIFIPQKVFMRPQYQWKNNESRLFTDWFHKTIVTSIPLLRKERKQERERIPSLTLIPLIPPNTVDAQTYMYTSPCFHVMVYKDIQGKTTLGYYIALRESATQSNHNLHQKTC